MDKKEKIKYDSKYIAYVESGESAAVFVARDIAKDLDTRGKWIDIIYHDGHKKSGNKWIFKTIQIELFPRKTKPVYPENASEEDKKNITWQAALKDIVFQRSQGYKGPKYVLTVKTQLPQCKKKFIPEKVIITKRYYSKVYHCFFDQMIPNGDCEERIEKKVINPGLNHTESKPFEYIVTAIKKIG